MAARVVARCTSCGWRGKRVAEPAPPPEGRSPPARRDPRCPRCRGSVALADPPTSRPQLVRLTVHVVLADLAALEGDPRKWRQAIREAVTRQSVDFPLVRA